jgi:hypothetical protein
LRSRLTATVADFTALAALSTTNKLAGDLAYVSEGAVYMSWSGANWVQITTARFVSAAVRDTAYAKASAAFRVVRVRALDVSTGIESAWNGSAWVLDYEVSTTAIAANAGYTIVNQRTHRSGRTVSVSGTVTKSTNWVTTDTFGTLAVGFRPTLNTTMGSALDGNASAVRGALVTGGGVMQLFDLVPSAGTNTHLFTITYVIT